VSGAASRRKGQAAEQAVARWLRANGWTAKTSRAVSGAQQGSDLVTDTPVSWEVKNHARMELAAWIDQAVGDAEPDRPAVVIHKRAGKASPADWYCTMRGQDLLELLRRVR
jgi:hypothetical protein